MTRSPYEQMKPESFCTKGVFSTWKSPPLPFSFSFFLNILAPSIDFPPPPPPGNIHRCAKPPLTATLAEAKNEIYTWLPSSTMCNHHLIGKWSRVQTGKGKAWLKPTSPRADDTPLQKQSTRWVQSSRSSTAISSPLPALTDINQSRSTKGSIFHREVGCWLPSYISLFSFLLRKTKQVLKTHSHEAFLVTDKRQIHREKPRGWGFSSEHSQVQQWHSPSFSTQRQ